MFITRSMMTLSMVIHIIRSISNHSTLKSSMRSITMTMEIGSETITAQSIRLMVQSMMNTLLTLLLTTLLSITQLIITHTIMVTPTPLWL